MERCWVWVNKGGGGGLQPPKQSHTPRGHTLAGGGPRASAPYGPHQGLRRFQAGMGWETNHNFLVTFDNA